MNTERKSDAFRSAEDKTDQDLRRAFESCAMPEDVKAKLDAAVGGLGQTNVQAASKTGRAVPLKSRRRFRTPMVAAAAMATVLAFGGAAYAGAHLLNVGNGSLPFFGNKSMSVYDSMQVDAESMMANVGLSKEANGATVTLDSVSCDRNVANVYLTISRDGDFSAEGLKDEKGSNKSEWALLQDIIPTFDFNIAGDDAVASSGVTNILDAYLENGKIKAMLRVTPERTMPEAAEITLSGKAQWNAKGKFLSDSSKADTLDFAFNLDLSNVNAPRELGARTLTFDTSEGSETLDIERFTVSKLGCVMVTTGGDAYGPTSVQVTDNNGNTLVPVYAGDAVSNSYDLDAQTHVIEYAGASTGITSVTFTPYSCDEDASRDVDKTVDVSKRGAKIATSEYGGYTVEGRVVENGVVTVKLKPYGMVFDNSVELYPEGQDKISTLDSGGQGIVFHKVDYSTGELSIITSYYVASDEELEAASTYTYSVENGNYRPETSAAQTVSF